jgi:hypothetical protein
MKLHSDLPVYRSTRLVVRNIWIYFKEKEYKYTLESLKENKTNWLTKNNIKNKTNDYEKLFTLLAFVATMTAMAQSVAISDDGRCGRWLSYFRGKITTKGSYYHVWP